MKTLLPEEKAIHVLLEWTVDTEGEVEGGRIYDMYYQIRYCLI